MMGMMRVGTTGGLRNLVEEALGKTIFYSNFWSFCLAEISFRF
jgi:hypothetical protein